MNLYNTTRLTPSEIKVLKLLSQEYTTKEIAKELTLSCSTIETHRHNLLSKMDVKNVAGLIRRSFELELLIVERKSKDLPKEKMFKPRENVHA